MNTAKEVMEHANKKELKGICFYDKKGRFAEGKRKIVSVKYSFHDGKSFTLSIDESLKLNNFYFKLRPTSEPSLQ